MAVGIPRSGPEVPPATRSTRRCSSVTQWEAPPRGLSEQLGPVWLLATAGDKPFDLGTFESLAALFQGMPTPDGTDQVNASLEEDWTDCSQEEKLERLDDLEGDLTEAELQEASRRVREGID
jgi:hypothetical protein